MKFKSFLVIALIFSNLMAFGWGKTGHRVVGDIAYWHLDRKAKGKIHEILKHEHLNMVGNYMDFVRSDKDMGYMSPWHYCTVPDGETYSEAPEEGDAVETINRLIEELKTKKFTYGTELENLKYLVHLVADIHQPLHVGNGEDKGGNDVKVTFMWEESNLHRVWDSGLIDYQQLSFTEYSKWVNHISEQELEKTQSQGIDVWIEESMNLRPVIYDIPENGKLSYEYNYKHIATINDRLLKAGVRLAGILNEIYG
ncbi:MULTISPECIES: S1/P1 nuclease [Reichenbachiella]|uniref:S1/P1 Nuclease n=1 Tax=Reichenbachiella agariperforans TaxID=156994 RepID=A0A1M6P7A7_REIAG|nr:MULTISPECIES: S1/P1 nuclease [Reichenbachiella]MBU2914642.1 S1/P1 nuclease [Reichenbachiella agariperforans]RJE71568.1 S1/P1 Nuclease [Reichenbachiella sp. MSK19-1]SHK03812.1 S1/P1 Nuclease [Reichenbachiella agariperforans]